MSDVVNSVGASRFSAIFPQDQALVNIQPATQLTPTGRLTCPCFNSPQRHCAARSANARGSPAPSSFCILMLNLRRCQKRERPCSRKSPSPKVGRMTDGATACRSRPGNGPATGGRPGPRLDGCALRHKLRVNRGLVAPPRRCDIALPMQPSMVVLCLLVCLSPRSLSSPL